MHVNKIRVLLGLLAGLFFVLPADAVELRFSGFGDFVLGFTGGDFADQTARTSFESFGIGDDPVNTMRGFQLTGTDFVVIADMSDDVTFLGEINFQAGRGVSNEIETDVERFFVDFKMKPRFNVQAGLFFTPIGYNNRFLYARAWLMNSIQVPDFFEEELNLIPTHTVGVTGYGGFVFKSGRTLNWSVSAGNGRAHAPDETIYARDISSNKEFTWLLEWLVPGYKDSRFGISGWRGNIDSVRIDDPSDPPVDLTTGEAMGLRETGLDAYAVVNTKRFSLNAEWVLSRQEDRIGNLPDDEYKMNGGLIEAALHLRKGKLHPYVRYDKTSVPDGGGPYLSLREDGGFATRHYIPEFEAVMAGAAYDVSSHTRVKLELQRHLGGPRQENGAALQVAYGF